MQKANRVQIETLLRIVSKAKTTRKPDSPRAPHDDYFKQFEGVNEAAMIPRTPPDLTTMHQTLKICRVSDLRAERTFTSPTKDAWLDAYQHSLRESIAACSEGITGAEQDQRSRSQGSSAVSAIDLCQNSSDSSAEHITSTGLHSRQRFSAAETQDINNDRVYNASMIMHGRAATETARAIDGFESVAVVTCPDKLLALVPDAAYDGYIPDLPELVPYQYDYIDGMELEANLSRQLLDGETWQNDHFMGDMSIQPSFWYSESVNNLGYDAGMGRRPTDADLHRRIHTHS